MKRTWGDRIHAHLQEPDGQEFIHNKWKFWLVAVVFLSIINSVLTWLIFQDDNENYSGPILVSAGTLVSWLCVCALHYSDSQNRPLARNIAIVDSAALLFVVFHFCGLLYVYGHYRTLRSAELRYEAQAEKFNASAQKVSTDNVEIARAAQMIASETTKAEKFRNDTAYQMRRAARVNKPLPFSASGANLVTAPSLSTAPIALERPDRPKESSTEFLTKYDWAVRAANFGELLLAALTLILIRNHTSKTNIRRAPVIQEDFPEELDARASVPNPRGNFTKKKETPQNHAPSTFDSEGLKKLREYLKEISFHMPGKSFKANLRGDAVWVYMVQANSGTQQTIASAKAHAIILDDALRMEPDAFRAKLEKFLMQNEFPIGETSKN